MTKADLCKAVAEKSGVTKAQAEAAVDCLLESVTGALASGDKVTFTGFGTFEVSERKARVGRNPSTGAAIQIPASKGIKFKPGKNLKDAVE
jgi:DNA-binding protein HU-beta